MLITDFFQNTGQIKEYIRGIDAQADISSFAPVYRPAAKKFINLVGLETYNNLKGHIKTPPQETDEDKDMAVNYSRGALANMLAISWFIFDSGERNATDKKLYRYQEDKIMETYLESTWAELDQLVLLLESKKDKFPEFTNSELSEQRETLYIKNAADFNKVYNINSSSYFYYNTINIQNEVEDEYINSRLREIPSEDDITIIIKRIIAFETVAIACQRFDFSELPRGLRNDITKEIGASGNRSELNSIKDIMYARLHKKALSYIDRLDIMLKSKASLIPPVVPAEINKEENKFFISI